MNIFGTSSPAIDAIILADEINRAPAKPVLCFAAQNPIANAKHGLRLIEFFRQKTPILH
ncbi:hypothetical protein ACYULU_09110 [Breznakiellaceae bacterium SP9]